ncbi:hypothetical protein EsDP_00005934 [Epichloe bromicola]|uniref:Tat pathway signal sequence n=1 Tax=Epichloe bromicola TaxID=79588 RepID=A0ABQ0CWK7_9HYPO
MDEKSPVDSITPGAHEPGEDLSAASPSAAPSPPYRHFATQYKDNVYNPGAIPRIPLRVPMKNARRSMLPPMNLDHRASCEPPSPASTIASTGHMLPSYMLSPMNLDHRASYEPPSPASTITSTGHMLPSYKVDSTGQLHRDESVPAPDAGDPDEKQWFNHRNRSRQFLVIVGIVTLVIIVTLAIALPVGLRNKVSTQGSQADDGDDPSGMPFPAGAFSFKTSLQKTEAGCTSKNTTWRCDPVRPGDSTTFYWDITQLNSYTYAITSNENPFAPDFKNVSMKIRDYSKPTERLEFSFSMNKTVTPSDASSPTNRAAKCTYADTAFQATLYTRKRGTTLFNPPKHHAKYSAWPGDVRIVQSLDSTIGQPMCRDAMNHVIADVGAGPGTCQCQYTNANSQT